LLKKKRVKQLDGSSTNAPSFTGVSEILSFVITSVSVTYRVFYPQGSGSHFSRAKCLSMALLAVRGDIVPLRHTSETCDSKRSFTQTYTIISVFNQLDAQSFVSQ